MKTFSILLLLAGLTFADEVNKRTVVTVNEPVIVAGVPQVTLQPGKYVLRLLNHDHNRNIVQILNERENKLFTTVLAINNYRLTPSGSTVLRFWETPRGNPPALRAWFAPGDHWGQEFVYPKGLATRIARETGGPVLTAPATTEAELRTAPVTEVVKSGEEKPLEEAYVTPPAVAPVPVRAQVAEVAANVSLEPALTVAEAPAPEPLPPTGSPVFVIGVAGLLIAAAGFGLRRAAFHRS
jgi:hypothetical protein